MSTRALCQAVLNTLRLPVQPGYVEGSGYGLNDSNSYLAPPDGQPAPIAGKFWVSVHEGPENQSQECSSERSNGVKITVAVRIDVPFDEVGPEVQQKALDGVNDHCGAIASLMTNNQYVIMNAANAIINAQPNGPWDGFVEPLFEEAPTPGELVSGDWYNGDEERYAAVRKTLNFGRAVRIQKIGNVMT